MITRCKERTCRTSVDLDDDPGALCDTCGAVTCWACRPTDAVCVECEEVPA
jgi:hypothetical protein